jgi:hypothetical protein
LTGDAALGVFPCLLVGSRDAVETTEPDDVCVDGPIFAAGCSSGTPLAWMNLLIKPSCEEADVKGGENGPGGPLGRSGTTFPFA